MIFSITPSLFALNKCLVSDSNEGGDSTEFLERNFISGYSLLDKEMLGFSWSLLIFVLTVFGGAFGVVTFDNILETLGFSTLSF